MNPAVIEVMKLAEENKRLREVVSAQEAIIATQGGLGKEWDMPADGDQIRWARAVLALATLPAPQAAEPEWMAAFDEARDAILHGRGHLEGEGLSNDQINAVLTVLDDSFMPHLKRGEPTPAPPVAAAHARIDAAIALAAGPAAPAAEPSAEQINAAAKVIAECFDYPWAHMPEQGRKEMRAHAAKVALALAARKQGDTK